MPFYTVYILMGRWDLGPLLCDLWLSVDYTVCLVSQYTVLLITIDRFCSVKIAAKYRSWRTKTRVIYMVTITWIIPALLFFISIFGWEHFTGKRDLKPGECVVQFLKDPVFNTALIIGYYWTTLAVLFVLYGGIYKTAYEMQKRSEAKQRRMQNMVALSAGAMSGMVERAAGLGMSSTPKQKRLPNYNESENFTAQISTVPPSQITSSTSSNQVGDVKERPDQPRKKSSVDITKVQQKRNGNDATNKESSTEIEKSERSSSPAFDSDDDNSSVNQLNIQQAQVILMKKRSSMGLVFSAQAALLATRSNETNGNTIPDPQPMPPSILKLPNARSTSDMQAVKITSLLDQEHTKQVEYDQLQPLQPTPIQTPISPVDIEPINIPKDQAHINLVHTILPPPDGFRGSPSIKSESPPSKSDRSDLFTKSDLTYDILGGMDGADLRYMDESSLAITSPCNESPNSNITFPQQNKSQSNQNIVNPSLLQKALIRAAKSQQPSTTTKIFLNENDIQINSSIFNTDLLEANLPPPPPPRSISSTIPLNKFDLTVTLATEKSSKKPVTSIVPANNNNNPELNTDEIQRCSSPVMKSVAVVQSTKTEIIVATNTVITADAKPSTTSSTASTSQAQAKVSTSDREFSSRQSSSRRDFIRSIGKKLKGGKKKLPLVGRTKSKSENRARKAFRTISFILGCFVMCWTPYHVIALVEGFCRNPPCINPHLFMFSYFLCYANSPMNPFCYALANQQFKKTFTRLLKGDFHMT